MASDKKLKETAKATLVGGKYPKKDGGVLSISTDEGEMLIMREGSILTCEFPAEDKRFRFQVGPDKQIIATPSNMHPVASSRAKDETPAPGKGKAAPAANSTPLARKNPEAPVKSLEPKMVEQMGYDRKPEYVNFNIYKNVIQCECGNVRYVKDSDMHQVTECKPCTRLHRRQRRRRSKKERGVEASFAAKKAAEKAAAAKGKSAKK